MRRAHGSNSGLTFFRPLPLGAAKSSSKEARPPRPVFPASPAPSRPDSQRRMSCQRLPTLKSPYQPKTQLSPRRGRANATTSEFKSLHGWSAGRTETPRPLLAHAKKPFGGVLQSRLQRAAHLHNVFGRELGGARRQSPHEQFHAWATAGPL